MPTLKLASWNIYAAHQLYRIRGRRLEPERREARRAENVTRIVRALGADLLGIQESMPPKELRLYQKTYFPDYLALGESKPGQSGIGLLFRPKRATVEKVSFPGAKWTERSGREGAPRTYGWTRKPLIVRVRPSGRKRSFLVAFVHGKSKRRESGDPVAKSLANRRQIAAEGVRLREVLARLSTKERPGSREFLIAGDINDAPGFDRYESQINKSGLEAVLGSVLDPDHILRSFVDLSDGRGVPTTGFRNGLQVDHILMTPAIHAGGGFPAMVRGSGCVRTDLVSIRTDGKRRDSDHAPIEVRLSV